MKVPLSDNEIHKVYLYYTAESSYNVAEND